MTKYSDYCWNNASQDLEAGEGGREKQGDDACLLLLTQKGAVPCPVACGEEPAWNKAVFYGKEAPSRYTHTSDILSSVATHPPGKSLLREERDQKPPSRTRPCLYFLSTDCLRKRNGEQ